MTEIAHIPTGPYAGFYVTNSDVPLDKWRWNSGELACPANTDGPYKTYADAAGNERIVRELADDYYDDMRDAEDEHYESSAP